MHTSEQLLKELTENRWGLTGPEGDTAIMVENEANIDVSAESSDPVLQGSGDSGATVAVGSDELLIDQIDELSGMFRDFARNADPARSKVYYDVNKALFRCVDVLSRCVSEHRSA